MAVDPTNLQTRETGLSGFTVYRSRNGGVAAAYTTPTVNETDVTNMPGVYELLIDEDTTLDAGDDEQEYVVHITHASMEPVTRVIEIYRPKITEGNTLGVASDGDISGNLDGTVATVTTLTGHTAQTGDSFARLGAPAGASVSADIAALNDPTAATIADAVWDEAQSAHVAAGSFGEIATEIASVLADTNELQTDDVPGLIAGLNDPTAATIADAVWDEAQSAHVAAGSFGEVATEIASILADTNELQTDDVPGLIAALNDPSAATVAAAVWNALQASHVTAGTFGEIATEIASILADTNELQTDDVPGLIAALNNLSAAQVNAEVLDVIATDTFAEPTSVPAATATLKDKIGWLAVLARNKLTQTATTQTLRNDADAANIASSTVSDDGTTATRGEWT